MISDTIKLIEHEIREAIKGLSDKEKLLVLQSIDNFIEEKVFDLEDKENRLITKIEDDE